MKTIFILLMILQPLRLIAQPYSAFSIDGSWSTGSSEGFTARYNLSSNVIDGKIYVIGGQGNFNFLNTLEVFDPMTDSWTTPTTTGTFPTHFGHTSSVVDGKIYVFGGIENPTQYDSNISVFDPTTKIWSTINVTEGKSFTPRWNLTSCVLAGKIYVIGGDTGDFFFPYTPSNIIEVFDPLTRSWSTPIAIDTLKTVNFLTSHVINGKIYVVGTIDDGHYSVITQVYDPLTNKWSTIEPTGKPSSRIYFTSSVVNDKIFIIGERKPEIEMFDPSINTWSTLATTGTFTNRDYLTSSAVEGKIYVMGGEGSGKNWLNTNEVFTPATNSVISNDSLSTLYLFPNPTTGIVTVSNKSFDVQHVNIANLLGETVVEFPVTHGSSFTIDLTKVHTGIYYAKFTVPGSIIIRKIIRQ